MPRVVASNRHALGERSAIMNLALVTLERGRIVRSAELARDSLELSQNIGDDGSATTVRCIEIAAQILGSMESTATAVSVLAAATRRREELGAPRPDIEQPEIDRVLQGARTALAPSVFEATWSRGRALPINRPSSWRLRASWGWSRPARADSDCVQSAYRARL